MKRPRRLSPGEEATLVEHLDELRTRLFVSIGAILIGFGVAFAFHERLIRTLEHALPKERRHLITFGVAEPFLTSMWVSLWAGLGLALPVVLWQLWSFLAPAFERHSQRIVAVFVAAASMLFAAGLAFGYYLALPAAVHFLTNYDKDLFNIEVRAKDYISFSILVLVATSVVFELPIFILALVRLGVLTTAKLRRNRKIGYAIVAAIAVALPGVDPVTTTLEAVPLLVLYELSIWLAVLMEKRWRPALAATEPS
ncbi:MAG: twin-arginine translocase subunit TatC [Actinomycetota bacterium]|nr:twin-arginine translocase subunit TatC [Actinomycetota bacterium]